MEKEDLLALELKNTKKHSTNLQKQITLLWLNNNDNNYHARRLKNKSE